MYCSDVEDLLSPYLDHELLPDENSLVEKHLQQCAFCRKALEELQETSIMICSLPNLPLPDGFQDQFHELLSCVDRDLYGNGKGHFKHSWLQWLLGSYRLVSAALILVLCFTAYSFTALQKNKYQVGQAPFMSSAELIQGQEDRSRMESTEKTPSVDQDVQQKALIQKDAIQSSSGRSKGQLFLFFVIAAAIPFLMVKIIFRFLRK